MKKIYEVEIAGTNQEFELQFKMLKSSQSLKFLMYLGKIIGGSVGKVIGSIGGESKIEELENIKPDDFNLEKIGDAIFGLMDRVDEDEVLEKLNLLLSSVRHNGTILNVDHMMFDGAPDLIFSVAKEAMGVNYKRFLDGNSNVLQKIIGSLKILKNTKG